MQNIWSGGLFLRVSHNSHGKVINTPQCSCDLQRWGTKIMCQFSLKQDVFYNISNIAIRVGCSLKLSFKVSVSAFWFLLLSSTVISSWRIGFLVGRNESMKKSTTGPVFLHVKDKFFKSPLDTDRQGIVIIVQGKASRRAQEHLLVRWSCTNLAH